MRKQILSIALAGAFAIPTLAGADTEIQTIEEGKVLVSYSLEEVSTEKGRAEVERQIRRAADRVCGPRTVRAAGSLTAVSNNRNCFKTAVAEAMRTLESRVGSVAAVSAQ